MSHPDIHAAVEHEDRTGNRAPADKAESARRVGLVPFSRPSPYAPSNSAPRHAVAGAGERVFAFLARHIGGGSAYPVPPIATARRRGCAERRLDRFTA